MKELRCPADLLGVHVLDAATWVCVRCGMEKREIIAGRPRGGSLKAPATGWRSAFRGAEGGKD